MDGNDLVIVIPLWRRTANIRRVYMSAIATTPMATVLFVVSAGDQAVLDALVDEGFVLDGCEIVDGNGGEQGDYAKKINAGYRATSEPFIFTGADDLDFQPGWYAAARAHMNGRTGVVGTVDNTNRRTMEGEHSTHSLVARWYADQGACVDQDHVIYHEGYQHEFCNPPEAPVWMADGTFRPLGEINIGDEVMGWERVPAGSFTLRALRPSRVNAIRARTAPLVWVEMESGRSFHCTPDHRWLNAHWTPAAERRWAAYPEFVTPSVGRTLLHVIDEPRPIPTKLLRTAGYLAGVYDGEGSGVQIAQCADANPVVRGAIREALIALDVPFTESRSVYGFTLIGGKQGYVDFLNRIQPAKRESLMDFIMGRGRGPVARDRGERGGRFGHRDKILSVEPSSPSADVISMTTSTGNYVAWGYASKNCDDELVRTAMRRGAYAHAYSAVVDHVHWNRDRTLLDDVYRHGKQHTGLSRRLFLKRRHLWGDHPVGIRNVRRVTR